MLFEIDHEGHLQFLCDAVEHKARDASVIALSEVGVEEQGLHRLPDMPIGSRATRRTPEATWEMTHYDRSGR
jgi:hypothetical protein